MGVYDPERLGASASLAIEHLYVDWNALEAASLAAALREAAERGRWPLLTIEPWPRPSDDPEALLGDIVAGEYDQAMRALCRVIGDFARPVFVRWGHEMEHVTGRYPWARNDPTAYVSAYRRVVDTCRRVTRNVFYVWSPAGNPGLEPYWPGRPYADWVGVSVFGFPAWDLAHVGKLRTFAEIFAEKYARVERFDRPVMIAELGVTGGESHQKLRRSPKTPGVCSPEVTHQGGSAARCKPRETVGGPEGGWRPGVRSRASWSTAAVARLTATASRIARTVGLVQPSGQSSGGGDRGAGLHVRAVRGGGAHLPPL